MQRNVRRIADLWKGQWDTQESMHSIRKWMQSHTHTHAHAHHPVQESSVHTWTPCSSLVSAQVHLWPVKLKVLVAQSWSTLCDPVDCSPLGASVHGILRARILEWVAVSFSRGSSRAEPGLVHCRWILYHLSNWGSPDIQNGIIRTPISNIFIFLSVVPRSHWILRKSQQNFPAFISSLLFYKWGY